MNWKRVLGYGVLMWIIMFALVSAFMAAKLYPGLSGEILVVIGGGIIAFLLALRFAPLNWSNAVVLALAWTIVGVALDFLITRSFNPKIFYSPSLWYGYGIGFLAVIFGAARRS